jgi:hypothetical protein
MVRITGEKIIIEIENTAPENALWLLKTSMLEVIGRAASNQEELGGNVHSYGVLTDFLQELELGEDELKKAFGKDEK